MRLIPFVLFVLLLLPVACRQGSDSTSPATSLTPKVVGERTPALTPDNPLYNRYEGVGVANACTRDTDCHVGGCSMEVCSADPSVVSTCEYVPPIPGNPACGCVEGLCIWYL